MPLIGSTRLFQSTLPLRGATGDGLADGGGGLISIHTPLAGSDRSCRAGRQREHISIHTPLAGSDHFVAGEDHFEHISIHTPLAGSDQAGSHPQVQVRFISIHTPLAGSDAVIGRGRSIVRISIHTPLAGSDLLGCRLSLLLLRNISIHALREESDWFVFVHDVVSFLFQSTLSVRRATLAHSPYKKNVKFQSTLSVRRATDSAHKPR